MRINSTRELGGSRWKRGVDIQIADCGSRIAEFATEAEHCSFVILHFTFVIG
jgi:hypothetical protein